jgi:hypothetical protein
MIPAFEGQSMTNAATRMPPAVETRRSPPNAPPSGWGDDDLTKFWDAARCNQFGTFVNKPIYRKLMAIDGLFATISKGWLNPHDEIGAMLLLRCHSAYRTAAGLAAAGQVTESFVMNRAVLEYAAYALHLHRNADARMIWLDRHKDAASMDASRNALSHNKVKKTIEAANQNAAERFEKLYQWAIDFGAHPNERSVTGNMKFVEGEGRREMLAIMQHGDGPQLDAALVGTARCGMCALEILQVVFNGRFEILGVNATMREVRRGL